MMPDQGLQGMMDGGMDDCGQCEESPPYVRSMIPEETGWSPDPNGPTGNPLVDRLTGASTNGQSLLAGMGLGPGAQPSSPTDQIEQLLQTGMQPLGMSARNPLAERIARGGAPPAPPASMGPDMQGMMPPMPGMGPMPQMQQAPGAGMPPGMGSPMMPEIMPGMPPRGMMPPGLMGR